MSDIHFYKFLVNKQVFYKSKHCYALVNIKPLASGHVMVVPYDVNITRFNDLSQEQSLDYMNTLQFITKFIIWNYKADSLNISIQDGPESGQSIPHLHTHIIPRFKNDDYQNDRIFSELEKVDLINTFEQRRKAFLASDSSKQFAADEDRVPRTAEQMEIEAKALAAEIEKFARQTVE